MSQNYYRLQAQKRMTLIRTLLVIMICLVMSFILVIAISMSQSYKKLSNADVALASCEAKANISEAGRLECVGESQKVLESMAIMKEEQLSMKCYGVK